MKTKINQLQQILRSRLPVIKRWKSVSVTDYDSTPEDVRERTLMQDDEVCISWNGRKTKQVHVEEFKTFPASELDSLIKRNIERRDSERKIYK